MPEGTSAQPGQVPAEARNGERTVSSPRAASAQALWARARPIALHPLTLSVVAAAAVGAAVSRATVRVTDWFVMTDELLYERLAISISRSGSLLPRVHGELVPNVNQLYPALLSLLYGHGDVTGSLESAHLLNAFVMASAAIPVTLLARKVLGRSMAALAVGVLSVSVPWIVLSSFLLTEVVAYPAFCWAALAITQSVVGKRARYDVLALLAIALAVLARTQLVALAVVFALAVLVEAVLVEAARGARGTGLVRRAASTLLSERRTLVTISATGIVTVVVVAALGHGSALLGTYSETARGAGGISGTLLRSAAEHLAVLSLAFFLLPLLVAVGWMLTRVRPSARPAERGFAVVALAAIAVLVLEVASFDERFGGGLVKDRYLFYVAPLVLVGLAGALASRPLPRLSVLVPAAICAFGFASAPLPRYEKLNVDSPVATLNDGLIAVAGSPRWAHLALSAAAVVLAVLFVEAVVLVRAAAVAAVLAAVVAAALPAQAVYAFDRLFAVDGTSGLPITAGQGPIFGWIDGQLGPGRSAAIVPYPNLPDDYWANASFWWKLEFWNEDVDRSATIDGYLSVTPSGTFPKLDLRFDPKTGVTDRTGSPYAVLSTWESRFAFRGPRLGLNGDAQLVAPERPWRAAWLSLGLGPGGWTAPRRAATIRVFAAPDEEQPVERRVELTVESPGDASGRRFRLASNEASVAGRASPGGTASRIAVCVPAGGYADVRVSTSGISRVYADQRSVGVRLRRIVLEDESTPVRSCGAPAPSSS